MAFSVHWQDPAGVLCGLDLLACWWLSTIVLAMGLERSAIIQGGFGLVVAKALPLNQLGVLVLA